MPNASDAPANMSERYSRAKKELKSSKSEEDRWVNLGEAAKAAAWVGRFSEAKALATEQKRITPKYADSWNYGNAIHAYNTALGLVALEEGDTNQAKLYLLASGKTPGSPQLNSFGPNMSLAYMLLLSGEKSTVLAYFDLCRNFWAQEELSEWRRIVSAGDIPDFGANMIY